MPDFSEPDHYEVQKEYDKQAYEEKKQAQLKHEEKLRFNLVKLLLKKKHQQGR